MKDDSDLDPANASKDDLFRYGTAAKISGVEGRGTGEFALLVEGVGRVSLDRITQERPYFEAEVTYEYDSGMFTKDLSYKTIHLVDTDDKQRWRYRMWLYRRSLRNSSSYQESF